MELHDAVGLGPFFLMPIGDPSDWAERFKRLDVRFLERVVALWPRCLAALPANPHEDRITISLVTAVSRDPQARRLFHHLAFHHEPFGYTDEGWAYSKGQIDMALLLDRERERYLAYECKRLNVIQTGKWRSLATPYMTEGVVRFVSEKYAADLPVGCMLGYVMDGNVSTARAKLRAAMTLHRKTIALEWGPADDEPLGTMQRFSSGHRRVSSRAHIEIRHTLLPFGVSRPADGTINTEQDGA